MVPVAWLLIHHHHLFTITTLHLVRMLHSAMKSHTLCHPRFSSNALIINYCSSWSIFFYARVAMRDSPDSSCKVHLNFISSHESPDPPHSALLRAWAACYLSPLLMLLLCQWSFTLSKLWQLQDTQTAALRGNSWARDAGLVLKELNLSLTAAAVSDEAGQ